MKPLLPPELQSLELVAKQPERKRLYSVSA